MTLMLLHGHVPKLDLVGHSTVGTFGARQQAVLAGPRRILQQTSLHHFDVDKHAGIRIYPNISVDVSAQYCFYLKGELSIHQISATRTRLHHQASRGRCLWCAASEALKTDRYAIQTRSREIQNECLHEH